MGNTRYHGIPVDGNLTDPSGQQAAAGTGDC